MDGRNKSKAKTTVLKRVARIISSFNLLKVKKRFAESFKKQKKKKKGLPESFLALIF